MCLGPSGENIQDQFGAVEHLDAGRFFQIASLGRRQIVVENHHIGVGCLYKCAQLLDFAFAQISRLVWKRSPLHERPDDSGARSLGQSVKFL